MKEGKSTKDALQDVLNLVAEGQNAIDILINQFKSNQERAGILNYLFLRLSQHSKTASYILGKQALLNEHIKDVQATACLVVESKKIIAKKIGIIESELKNFFSRLDSIEPLELNEKMRDTFLQATDIMQTITELQLQLERYLPAFEASEAEIEKFIDEATAMLEDSQPTEIKTLQAHLASVEKKHCQTKIKY